MPYSSMNVLVADDHAFQRRTLGRMLRGLGAKSVLEAEDGEAALQMLRQSDSNINLVICDLDMPRMDGMEFIRNVGKQHAGLPVILTSAHDKSLISSAASMSRAYGVELLGTIPKPPTPEALNELISRYSREAVTATRTTDRPAKAYPVEEISQGLQNGEFEPFFQPKIRLLDGVILGAEALARWRHPRDGLLLPAQFLPQMEHGELIKPLTWLMLRKAARQCAEWMRAGFPGTVAVNLSQTMLNDPMLADHIAMTVAFEGLEPSRMVIEITETAAMSDLGIGLENLTRLRMKGFGLSIDDYGTGYSSMQQLSRIPCSEVKIDRSFIVKGRSDEKVRAMIESSQLLTRTLGLKLVGEGVETRDEWELMKSLHVDGVQGYFVSRPLDANAYLHWLPEWCAPC